VWAFSARVYDGTEWSDWKNSSNMTILTSNPSIPSINVTSSDPLNYTNGTLMGWHNYNSPISAAWSANSTKWYNYSAIKGTTEHYYNQSIVGSGNTTAPDIWYYSAAVQDANGDYSIWYNASLTIINAPPYQNATPPDITFLEDGYNDTLNGNNYFVEIDDESITGFEFYANDTNLNTTITNASGAFLFTATNDWYGSTTGYITAVTTPTSKGNGTNFTITVLNVNDKPTIPWINITSSDTQNSTNGTLYGNHGYADLENNTWSANSTKWYVDGSEWTAFQNMSSAANGTISKGQSWIYSAAVQDSIGSWSDWLNSSSLTINDTPPVVTTPITNLTGLDLYDFMDIELRGKGYNYIKKRLLAE